MDVGHENMVGRNGSIDDILRRLSLTATIEPIQGNNRDGKLILQVVLIGEAPTNNSLDNNNSMNKIVTGAKIYCHMKFLSEEKEAVLKSYIPMKSCEEW